MAMLPPAPSVVVGAAVVKRFPGYGEHRGTIAEIDIDAGKVLIHWTTDERTTLTLKEAAKRVVASPPVADEDDDQSISSAAFGIESSATSFTAPRHVLLELDDEEDLRSIDGGTTVTYDSGGETVDYEGDGGHGGSDDGEGSSDDEEDEDWSPRGPERRRGGRSATGVARDGGAQTTSSRFWGVTWDRRHKKWQAYYTGAAGKTRFIGLFDDEEEAARAVNKAIREAGLEAKRHMNEVDATGALVPKPHDHRARDRSGVVAPDPAHDLTATTSKFWGVSWDKKRRRWQAQYRDVDGKTRFIGLFDTQEVAAHAVNAVIRRAGLEGRRKTNPVVDGQLVPRALKARGHGPTALRKRRRDESAAATPSPRARRR